MSRETQIEEMRKEVAKAHRFFLEDDDYESLDDYIADELYNAGYRKQSEGEWVFNRGRTYGEPAYYCSLCLEGASEYGYDKFCSNCGAKMKGGK
jgi:hypothetical protein